MSLCKCLLATQRREITRFIVQALIFVDRISILGSAEQCRAQIAAFVEAGVTTPVISPLAIDPRAITATFEAFAPNRGSGTSA